MLCTLSVVKVHGNDLIPLLLCYSGTERTIHASGNDTNGFFHISAPFTPNPEIGFFEFVLCSYLRGLQKI